MKPPSRGSSQSTSRTLVTRAVIWRPRMSKRMRSPRRRLRSRIPASIDTSGSPVVGELQNWPSTIFSFEARWSRQVMVNSRDRPPRPRTASTESRLTSRPVTPATRARATGSSRAEPRRVRASSSAWTPARWSPCTSTKNRSGASGRRSSDSRAASVRSTRWVARMKKQPRPTVTRITRVWCPGRPRPMTACRSGNQRTRDSGCTSRTKAAPAPTSAMADDDEPARDEGADPERSGLPGGQRREEDQHDHRGDRLERDRRGPTAAAPSWRRSPPSRRAAATAA